MISVCVLFFFFFKQKTAYEMRISDWSSDVCSSDLPQRQELRPDRPGEAGPVDQPADDGDPEIDHERAPVGRQRRRQRHPERKLRAALEDLDDPADDVVDPAAVVAGKPPDHDAEQERSEEHTYELQSIKHNYS